MYWHISCNIGDQIRIEFQRCTEPGAEQMKVSWRKTSTERIAHDQLEIRTEPRYFIVGSWDNETTPVEMMWDDINERYSCNLVLGYEGKESFQILYNGDFNNKIVPNIMDAHPRR